MLNIKPLTYYLSEDGKGLLEFKECFANKKIFEPIKAKIDLLIIEIEQSKWLEKDKRAKLFLEIQNVLTSHITCIIGIDPYTYFLEYIADLDKYCFQGGFGYRVAYTTGTDDKYCPHHWMIKAEHYAKFKEIPELVLLCATICNLHIHINDKMSQAIWV